MALSHPIDPDGDVDLLLHQEDDASHGNQEFNVPSPPPNLGYRRRATPDPKEAKKKKKGRREIPTSFLTVVPTSESAPQLEPNPPLECATRTGDESQPLDSESTIVRIRVSSKHLMLASAYFKRSLKGDLGEGHTLRSEGCVEIDMSRQDPDTMLLIMNTIHCRFRQLPSSIDLGTLTKISVLVDYLQCHEAMEPFAHRWIEQMKGDVSKVYSKALIQWLCVSLVFNETKIFKTVSRTALRQATGPLNTLGLPIRGVVEDKLNQQRSSLIEKLLLGLERLLEDLLYDRTQCSNECNALRYGTLAKELVPRGLLSPRPIPPFLGYSFENIVSSIARIEESSCLSFSTTCSSTPRINFLISQIETTLDGFSIDDFKW